MTESQHTPEPWHVDEDLAEAQYSEPDEFDGDKYAGIGIGSASGEVLSLRLDHYSPLLDINQEMFQQMKHDIPRMVACVNACAGINPKAIKELLAFVEVVATGAIYPDTVSFAKDLMTMAKGKVE